MVPIKTHIRSNNAAYNEYHVADLNIRHRIFSTRQGCFVSDLSQTQSNAQVETEKATLQPADEEIRELLALPKGENMIFSRSLQKSDAQTIVVISDTYLPVWFFNMTPELEKPDTDIYQLMIQLDKTPAWCTETLDSVQASSVERRIFGLSPGDPVALFKIVRRVFDKGGQPLSVDFLTDRGDSYRLHLFVPAVCPGCPRSVSSAFKIALTRPRDVSYIHPVEVD